MLNILDLHPPFTLIAKMILTSGHLVFEHTPTGLNKKKLSKRSPIIKDGSSVWELLGFGVVVFAFSTMSGFDREVINYLTSYIIIGLSKSFPPYD